MAIGDHLSDEQKKEYIRSRLIPGAIIYRFCHFTTPPKNKYLLVLQVKSDSAVFVINSGINAFIQSNQHMRDCQVLITQASHAFLDHDSYVDCTEAHYIDTAELFDELFNDLDGFKGGCTQELKQGVISALNDCYTISPGEIAQLLAALTT